MAFCMRHMFRIMSLRWAIDADLQAQRDKKFCDLDACLHSDHKAVGVENIDCQCPENKQLGFFFTIKQFLDQY